MRLAGSPTLPALAILALTVSGSGAQAQATRIQDKAPQGPQTGAAEAPVIGCQSLANLRLLLRRANDDPAAAAGVLVKERAEYLGCAVIGRDKVTAITDHVALNGRAYDCVGTAITSVCHWAVAGSVTPAEPARKTPPSAPEKGRR